MAFLGYYFYGTFFNRFNSVILEYISCCIETIGLNNSERFLLDKNWRQWNFWVCGMFWNAFSSHWWISYLKSLKRLPCRSDGVLHQFVRMWYWKALLTHSFPMHPFSTPWKHLMFLMFSGYRKRVYWEQMC